MILMIVRWLFSFVIISIFVHLTQFGFAVCRLPFGLVYFSIDQPISFLSFYHKCDNHHFYFVLFWNEISFHLKQHNEPKSGRCFTASFIYHTTGSSTIPCNLLVSAWKFEKSADKFNKIYQRYIIDSIEKKDRKSESPRRSGNELFFFSYRPRMTLPFASLNMS